MHVEMWGTKEWDISSSISDRYNERDPGKRYNDTDECIEQDPMEGFDLDVTRIFRKPGSTEVEKTDVTHVSYVPSDEVICGPAPTPTAAPVPAGLPGPALRGPLRRIRDRLPRHGVDPLDGDELSRPDVRPAPCRRRLHARDR